MNQRFFICYLLFGGLFAAAIVGLIVGSYAVLAIIAVLAVILGAVADKIENRPTEPFKKYQSMHHRLH